MKRRALLLALLAAPLTPAWAQSPALTAQDRADIARVEAYLDRLKTLKAHFLQVGPDGDVSEGTAWIDRPGKMRFEYSPPSPYLLVAGYGVGFFHDKSLGQTSNFPVSASPLGILLDEHVHLSGDVSITAVNRLPGQLQLTLIHTGNPGKGSITLIFADQPLALKQWVIDDAQHRSTSVSLYDVALGGTFDANLFQFADPKLLKPRDSTGG